MKIQFLGTAAAEGIPALFCDCEFCKEARRDPSLRRSRSQVLIDGVLSVDFPPDAYYHAVEFGVNFSALKYVLVTHSHMDHFYAHDFCLRGYKYSRHSGRDKLEVLGNGEVMKVFSECTRREMKPEVEEGYELSEIAPISETFLGGYRVLAIPAAHSAEEDALLFYVEKDGRGYMHLYDTGPFDLSGLDFLSDMGAKASVVAFDCTMVSERSPAGARHMGFPNNLELRDELLKRGLADADTKFVITHFSHNSKPGKELLEKIERDCDVIAARDGMTIEV
ncbi:MAG: MBL fold metallo-hydrolase [Clostridia bacterium]|nr:MBL fold metallo-hydrolase [Clostridia bacterium]